jgi:hypothetical protein
VYYNITFSYGGDGSDVVSDVANEIIASIKNGSDDCISFDQAQGGTAGLNNVTIAQSQLATGLAGVKDVGTSVAKTAGDIAGGAVGGAASGIFSNLGTSGWIVFALAALAVLAYFAASTGIRVRE